MGGFLFAWYSAAQAAGAISGSHADQIATAKASVASTTDIGVTLTVTEVDDTSTLILAERYDNAWRTAYYNTSAGSAVYTTKGEHQAYSKAYLVKITGITAVSGYTTAQLATLIKAKGFSVTITVNDNLSEQVLYEEGDNDIPEGKNVGDERAAAVVNPFAARTVVWASKTQGGDPDEGALADDAVPVTTSGANSFTFSAGDARFGEWDGSTDLVLGWVALYIQGGASSQNDGDTPKNTKVTVTLAELS